MSEQSLSVARTRVREPLPPSPGYPARQDYEYEREGTCNLFLFLEPQLGWRHVEVTKRRTKQDFAQAMKDLVDRHFPDAKLLQVVLDKPPHVHACILV